MRITWQPSRRRFEFEALYRERKAIREAGCRWDGRRGCWYTASARVAARFEGSADWLTRRRIREGLKRLDHGRAASLAKGSDVAIPAPEGLEYFPFQKAGIVRIRELGNALLADDMGLGKTVQALGLMNLETSLRKALVVCPASLKINWTREAAKWLVEPRRPQIVDGTSLRLRGDTELAVVNWDILARFEKANPRARFDLLVADEAHYGKNPKAQRSKALKRLAARCGRKLLMTGTPICNRPAELHPLVNLVDPTLFPNFRQFGMRYCDGRHNGFSWNFQGASHLEELQGILRERVMVRRQKADVLAELPAKTRTVVEIEPEGWQVRVALDAEADYAKQVGQLEQPSTIGQIADAARARHATALAKVPAVVRFAEGMLAEQRKLIVFGHHKDVLAGIRHGLDKYSPVVVTGSTPSGRRQELADRFQEDAECRVFLGNIMAAGTGLTLTAAKAVLFAELDWVPGNMTQAEDRAHRIGQTDNVQVVHLVVAGSIDARLAHVLTAKQDVIDRGTSRERLERAERKTAVRAPRVADFGPLFATA